MLFRVAIFEFGSGSGIWKKVGRVSCRVKPDRMKPDPFVSGGFRVLDIFVVSLNCFKFNSFKLKCRIPTDGIFITIFKITNKHSRPKYYRFAFPPFLLTL